MKRSGLISVGIILFFSSMCFGQATANFTASVTIIQPVGISTTSNMDFANLDASSGGEVILTPDNARITTGGIELAEGGQVSAATFEVTGQAGFTFAITLPEDQYTLSNGSESIIIKDFTSNYDGTGLLAQGSHRISVGATLDIDPNQTPGKYVSQAPLNITVNYN